MKANLQFLSQSLDVWFFKNRSVRSGQIVNLQASPSKLSPSLVLGMLTAVVRILCAKQGELTHIRTRLINIARLHVCRQNMQTTQFGRQYGTIRTIYPKEDPINVSLPFRH